jgi:hypothetical protein
MSIFSSAVSKLAKGAKRLVTDPGKALKNIGKSAIQAAPIATTLIGLPGVGTLGSSLLGGLASKIAGAIPSPLRSAASAIAHGAGDVVGAVQKKGFSVGDIVKGGLEAAGAVSGINSANQAGRAASGAMTAQSGLANELANSGRATNARATMLADPAAKALLARLQAGPSTQFLDRSNPFTANFAPPTSQPNPVAAAPMGATPILPPPTMARKMLPRFGATA